LVDDPEHFQAQSTCQRRFAPMVFAITGIVFGFAGIRSCATLELPP
jgi:hypothetical protein